MKCNYEIEFILSDKLSFDTIQELICKKIARLIILDEKKSCTFQNNNDIIHSYNKHKTNSIRKDC